MKPYYENSLVRLFHGDAREFLPQIGSGLTVTDPPYNVGYGYDEYKDRMDGESYQSLLLAAAPPPCVVIHYIESLFDVSRTMGISPEKVVSWVYPSNTPRQWRGIAWFGCRPDFNKCGQDYKNTNDRRVAKLMESGKRARLYDWWEVNQVKNVCAEKTGHPCQIPVEIMSRILKITDSEMVIDPFAGSGTTLLAASRLGRKAAGCEISERYCEIIANRLEEDILFHCPQAGIINHL